MASNNKNQVRDSQVCKMRTDGATYREIAEHFGFKYTQEVYKILALNGLVDTTGASRTKMTPDLKTQLCKDRVELKLTYMQLCVKYQVSTAVVNKVLREAGLTN